LEGKPKHPFLDVTISSKFGRQETSILYVNQYHSNLEDKKKHPILDVNQYRANLEDKKHPFLDKYCLNSSLYREMHKNHPLLDDYYLSAIIIHFWMKM